MEANKTNTKQNETISAKSLNGAEQSSNWEKAAELIAGDNKLMGSLLKLIISPFALLAGAGLIAYLFFKNKGYKDEITKLKEENAKLLNEKSFLAEEAETQKRKYKKLKKVLEVEQSQEAQSLLPQDRNRTLTMHGMQKEKMKYLD